jgi:hypothetical protein
MKQLFIKGSSLLADPNIVGIEEVDTRRIYQFNVADSWWT